MSFLSKWFGGGKATKEQLGVEKFVEEVLSEVLELSHLALSFDLKIKEEEGAVVVSVDLFGEDEEMLKEREGQLLDAFQLLMSRMIQQNFNEEKIIITFDCDGFRESNVQSLQELADKLRNDVIEKGKPVYFKALPPRDRKVIHQRLADDERVKSRSIGDGHFKKIKIFPAKM